jgi:hypothetical protein
MLISNTGIITTTTRNHVISLVIYITDTNTKATSYLCDSSVLVSVRIVYYILFLRSVIAKKYFQVSEDIDRPQLQFVLMTNPHIGNTGVNPGMC